MIYKGLVAGFLTLLILVCIAAAIAGENNRLGRQATALLDNVAARNYRGAYKLLTDDSQATIPFDEFTQRLRTLRDTLVARYGYDFADEVRFTATHAAWFPWTDAQVITVTIQPVRKESGWQGEVKQYLNLEMPVGESLPDLVAVTRVGTRWRIADIAVPAAPHTPRASLFQHTDGGFAFAGFSYSSTTTSSEQRAAWREDLERALAALDADDPKKAAPSIDLPLPLP